MWLFLTARQDKILTNCTAKVKGASFSPVLAVFGTLENQLPGSTNIFELTKGWGHILRPQEIECALSELLLVRQNPCFASVVNLRFVESTISVCVH